MKKQVLVYEESGDRYVIKLRPRTEKCDHCTYLTKLGDPSRFRGLYQCINCGSIWKLRGPSHHKWEFYGESVMTVIENKYKRVTSKHEREVEELKKRVARLREKLSGQKKGRYKQRTNNEYE